MNAAFHRELEDDYYDVGSPIFAKATSMKLYYGLISRDVVLDTSILELRRVARVLHMFGCIRQLTCRETVPFVSFRPQFVLGLLINFRCWTHVLVFLHSLSSM